MLGPVRVRTRSARMAGAGLVLSMTLAGCMAGITGLAEQAPPMGNTYGRSPSAVSKGRADAMGIPPTAPVSTASPVGDAGSPRPETPQPTASPTVSFNPFVETAVDAQSTFSVDVDTASYTLARRDLLRDSLPGPVEIRVEEFINYFDYDYPQPADGPFSISLEAAPSHFSGGKHLFRVGIQGREVPADQRQPANLVFLIDVSGSMLAPNKIELVKFALKQLVDKLQPTDTLGIVVYASQEGVVLPPTPVKQKSAILDAIDGLSAGGSTHAEAGIRKAYDLAESARKEGGINRVILCTDGDFNVGATGPELVGLIERFRDRGINLTTLGFGMGNYKDGMLEQLADKGDGNYAYVDSADEAMRVLGTKLVSTLQVIAKDVKIQVDFNPATVRRYRLIGYENRDIADQDFTNDKVDAGEIGAGHNVTAYYELEMQPDGGAGDLATVKVRYKQPDGTVSTQVDQSLRLADIKTSFAAASASFRFGAAVTGFAELLRGSPFVEGLRFEDIILLANETKGADRPERDEVVQLMQKAARLKKQ